MAACRTVKVEGPDGGPMTINEADFDTDIHKPFSEDKPRGGRRSKKDGDEGNADE